MALALTGARLFDGEIFHDNKVLLMENRVIVDIVSEKHIPPSFKAVPLKGGILAPGFIDVQVNGGGGALLNENPSAAVVRTIANAHRNHGTTGLLPTVITDAPEITSAAIAAVRQAQHDGAASVLGIHIEGPFLDPRRKGAHDPLLIRAMSQADVDMVTAVDCGVVLLTLAPNMVTPAMIHQLVDKGIKVSLGHAEATFAEACSALDAGASCFTHLFNAMSQLAGREPGMVGAALNDTKSFIGIIADGFHVHDMALKLAMAATAPGRYMLVSDAMPPAAGGPDTFTLQGRTVQRVQGRLQLADGTLAGSNLTMDEAVRYCVNKLHVPLEQALQMASRNPARFLGREDLGVIAPSALASLVHLDDNLNVLQTWVEGA